MAEVFTATEIIAGIDYSQLKGQKLLLLEVIDSLEKEGEKEKAEDLTGIINLIDHIQDHAVDVLGMNKYDVFNLTNEEE